MASKLDKFELDIMLKKRPDRDIAREAGVTLPAIRGFRSRKKAAGWKPPEAKKAKKAPTKKPAPKKSKEPTVQEKLQDVSKLLGTVPDSEIAEKVGTTAAQVGRFRRKQGIAAFQAPPAVKPEAEKEKKATAKTKKATEKVLNDLEVPVVIPEGGKTCSKAGCGAHAEATYEAIHALFGFRKVPTKDGHKKIPQPQCRECRKASTKASKAKKKAEAASKADKAA